MGFADVAPLLRKDPLQFGKFFWPEVNFYSKQREAIRSVLGDEKGFKGNDETFVPAGNELGKDFVAGFIALCFFLTRNPVRIVTTSAKDDHLRVLWGEIGRFIQSSSLPDDRSRKGVLDAKNGGPLVCNHQDIRKVWKGERCKISYLIGMVAGADSIAAMQGHHATPENLEEANDGLPRTLFMSDESSSVPHEYYKMALTWAKRTFVFGNTWPCDNFFKHAIKGRPGTEDRGGDIPDPSNPGRCYRKVLQIKAKDSPNVRFGEAQRSRGIIPTNEVIVPGVKSFSLYEKHRATMTPQEATVVLDAEFWEGADTLLYPREWLERAKRLAVELKGKKREARAIGIDPAEGGDSTSMSAVDEYGLLEQVSKKTPDTSVVTGEALAFMRKWNVPADRVVFDRGGGGKEHSDRLRAQGFDVRSVGFGENPTPDPKRSKVLFAEKKETKESRYAYLNRRAEMYGDLRELLDPANDRGFGFAIPDEYYELHRQLAPLPLWYDSEGRLYLPPKHQKSGDKVNPEKMTIEKLLGCSPDEADSLVLAVYGMLHRPARSVAGAIR